MSTRLRTIVMLAALLLGTAAGSLFAQERLPAELQQAMNRLEAGRAESALALTESWLEKNPEDEFTAAGLLLAGRAEVRMGRPSAAIQRGLIVLDKFGTSGAMASQAYYLLGTAHQQRGDHYEAARALVQCLDLNPPGNVGEMAMKHLRELVKGPVAYRAGTLRLLAREQSTRRALDAIMPDSEETPTFGVILPRIEKHDDSQADFLEGVHSAVQRWRKTRTGEVNLLVREVVPGAARHVHAARELVRDQGVWGLVVYGDESDVIAATVEAQAARVPVVLPGQRRPGLNALGPSVILPEADWRREGQIIAAYAVDSLGLKTFGIVAPHDDRGVENVQGFREVLKARGDSLELLAQEWYFPEEGVSVARQFQRIRTVGFHREFRDSLYDAGMLHPVDSLRADTLFADSLLQVYVEAQAPEADEDTVAVMDTLVMAPRDSLTLDSLLQVWHDRQFRKLWNTHIDSIQRTVEFKTGKIDSNDIELAAYDALYFPIEPGSIELFAPQFAFYNFKTTRLGNSAWYVPEEVYRNRQYLENLLFTAPYRLERRAGDMGELRQYLRLAANEHVRPWHIRGYDAVNILLHLVEQGRFGPWEVAVGAMRLDSLRLTAGKQTFGEADLRGREMWLLTVREGIVKEEDTMWRRDLLAEPVPADTLQEGEQGLMGEDALDTEDQR